MSAVITVENLSKKYTLGHQKPQQYNTLRDVIVSASKTFARKLINPFAENVINSSQEQFWALNDVNFEIQQGNRVGIIGQNGAGKSTLLKILSRIVEPTKGRIYIRGRIASLLEVGTGFHPELSGRENIYLNGAILGMRRAEIKRKFDEIVSFAEVEKFLDTPVKRYSSGMYVRLAFSVAAHLEPDILLVDEILAVGDTQFQKKCIGKLEEVGKEGRTVLFVSHNMATVKALCEKGVLLKEGKVVFDGKVDLAVNTYLSSTQTNAIQIPIAKRKRDKKCTLRAKIIDITVKAGDMLNPEAIDCKLPFTVCLTIESEYEIKCSAQILLCDEMQPLSYLDSGTLHGKMYNLNDKLTKIECKIGPTNLYAGNYKIKCSINVPFIEVIDEIEDAYSFEVRECDPYDSGYNILKNYGFGLFHLPHEWS